MNQDLKYIGFPDTVQLHSELLRSRPNQNVLNELSEKMTQIFKENNLSFDEDKYGKFSFNNMILLATKKEDCIVIESSEHISFPVKYFKA